MKRPHLIDYNLRDHFSSKCLWVFSKIIAHMYERLRLFLERRPAESKRRERRLEYDSCVAGVVADVVAFHRMSRGKLAAVPARLVRHDAFHSLFIKIIDRLILILDIYVGSQRLLKQKKEKEKMWEIPYC